MHTITERDMNSLLQNRTERTFEKSQHGSLEVYTTYDRDNNVLSKLFTFASLGEVLGVPSTTMEGRYTRGRLKYLKRDITSRAGRPVRGFAYDDLEKVITIVQTPGAFATGGIVEETPERHRLPLVATLLGGEPHYTIAALADYFGRSHTTIRNKLTATGLIDQMVSLGASQQGGRPRRAFHESMLGAVKQAVEEGVSFATPLDKMIASSTDQTAVATRQMLRDTNPFRVVNAVKSSAPTSYDDLAAQLDAMMSQGVVSDAGANDVAALQERIDAPNWPDITPESFNDRMAKYRARHIEDLNAPPNVGEAIGDVTALVGGLYKDQDHPRLSLEDQARMKALILTPEQIKDTVQGWVDAWDAARELRVPAIEACGAMAARVLIEGRDEMPSVAEVEAMMQVYSRRNPFKDTEYGGLRDRVIGAHHGLAKLMKTLNRDELEYSREFHQHRDNFLEMWNAEEEKLNAQLTMARQAKEKLVNAYATVPGEEVFEQAIAELVEAGVHPIYATVEIGHAKGFLELVYASVPK